MSSKKRYVAKIRGTDLWIKEGYFFGSSYNEKHYLQLFLDPLHASHCETFKSMDELAEKYLPEGHWSVHTLVPLTEQVEEEPITEKVVVSAEVSKETIVKIEEADEGVIARVMRKIK